MIFGAIGFAMINFWRQVREALIDFDISKYLFAILIIDSLALGYIIYIQVKSIKSEKTKKDNKNAKEFKEAKYELDKLFEEINNVENQSPAFYYQVYMTELAKLVQKYGNHEHKKSIYEKYDEADNIRTQMSDSMFASAADRAKYRLDKKTLTNRWAPLRSSMNIVEWAKAFTTELEALWDVYGIADKKDERRFFEPTIHVIRKVVPKSVIKLTLDDDRDVCRVSGEFTNNRDSTTIFVHVPIDSKEMELILEQALPQDKETLKSRIDDCKREFARLTSVDLNNKSRSNSNDNSSKNSSSDEEEAEEEKSE